MTTVPARIYSRVLVPLDGSAAAEFAVRFGADLASKHDAELVLFYLRFLPAPVGGKDEAEPEGGTLEQTRQYLEGLRRDLRADGIRVQDRMAESHDLPEALLKFIESERISVVVMSTQGRTSMMRWLLGSHIESALNNLPVPILLVRPMYQKVVVPLDGSKWSESAIPRAVEIARVHAAEVILLHIYQSKAGRYEGQWALAGQQEIADQTYEQMRDQLVALRNRLRAEGLSAREVLIRSTNPAQAICDFVNGEDGISLIVMSTHGRTGLARWLVGSTAQKVLKQARCPVTLVHPE
jgi:nucleotide-binding universal stress UspA family protein